MRNPTRRSRNIGTAKQGHGQNNRLVLPFVTRSTCRFFFENLRDFQTESRKVGKHELKFLIEKPRPDVVHACSVDDIARVLSFVPGEDLNALNFVVLRQPKRKEELLNPVWGRYIPFFEAQDITGSAIILESLDLNRRLRWEKPLSRDNLARLEKLRSQGHTIVEAPRFFEIVSNVEAVRQTQLFETLPHEVGHHVHASTDAHFWNCTTREKEAFAEKYEAAFMRKFGAILHEGEKR